MVKRTSLGVIHIKSTDNYSTKYKKCSEDDVFSKQSNIFLKGQQIMEWESKTSSG